MKTLYKTLLDRDYEVPTNAFAYQWIEKELPKLLESLGVWSNALQLGNADINVMAAAGVKMNSFFSKIMTGLSLCAEKIKPREARGRLENGDGVIVQGKMPKYRPDDVDTYFIGFFYEHDNVYSSICLKCRKYYAGDSYLLTCGELTNSMEPLKYYFTLNRVSEWKIKTAYAITNKEWCESLRETLNKFCKDHQ